MDLQRCSLRARIQPMWFYAMMTTLFFTLSVINNKAFDFHISQPLHMVFRSSSLAASYVIGRFVFKQT